MGDDIPSDIEASDKEEEAYSSEDECMDDEDSGFASNSFTFQAVPASESRKRKRYPSLPSDYDSEAEREELRAMKLELLAGQERVRVAREAGMARDRAQREQAQKARVDIEEDVVGTSEEEQALETATDEEEMCEEEEEEE